MFIHLGEDIIIQSEDVIAIMDGDLLNHSTIFNEFVQINTKNKRIVEIVKGMVKSIVVTENKIYFSPLSTITLKRRSQYVSELELLGE